MPSFNFTKFVSKVEAGLKPCTIRAEGKRTINVGDTLHLFSGMRTRNCVRLNCSPQTCISKTRVKISGLGANISLQHPDGSWKFMTKDNCKILAELDGFSNLDEMLEYFTDNYTKQFTGFLYQFRYNQLLQFVIKSTINNNTQ